jgi:hypothetical protein
LALHSRCKAGVVMVSRLRASPRATMVYLYDIYQTIAIRLKFSRSLPALNIN